MTQPSGHAVIAIIGGGFTGAAVAWYLGASRAVAPGSVLVFEPRDKLGLGLAYSTQDTAHRINVPASRMSLFPDDAEHFVRWIQRNRALKGDPDADGGDGHHYPRRFTFGAYVHSQLQTHLDLGHVIHKQARASHLARTEDNRWAITDETGETVHADFVVLATSHPAPEAPVVLSQILKGHRAFIPDPTVENCLEPIQDHDRILIIGNGLTSADVMASLAGRGHTGPVTSVSRRGLRSRAHAPVVQDAYGDFTGTTSKTAVNLLRRIRSAIIEADALGLTWHSVLDAVRAQGQDIWAGLDVAEQRRIVRHLRPFWDVHRFRIAPQVDKVVADGLNAGRIRVLAARLGAVSTAGDTIRVALRPRGQTPVVAEFDAVIVTTGPAHGGILQSQPLLKHASDDGLLVVDPTGLGLWCNRQSEALNARGEVDPGLYIAGPLARGTFGELMGIPQVSEHAKAVADAILQRLAQQDSQKPGTKRAAT